METKEKLQLLENEVDQLIQKVERHRDRDRRKAFALKIAAVLFAATITVLLGLDGIDQYWIWLKNIALILGASITVINAYEAFFDHRALWVGQTVTLFRLRNLRRELGFYIAGTEPAEIDAETAAKFINRINHIMEDALREWLKLRSEGEMEASEIQANPHPASGDSS